MAEAELYIVVKARNEAQRELKSTDESITRLTRQIGIMGTAAGVASGIIGVGLVQSVRDAAGAVLSFSAKMEQNSIAFKVLAGNAALGIATLKELEEFARVSPLETGTVVEMGRRLLAMDFQATELVGTMRMLGDISAGVGTEKLPQLVLALGQVRSAGHLTGMELRQFTEAGVGILTELSTMYGTTTGKMRELIEEGRVGFPSVEAALKRMTAEGGRFHDLTKEQEKSFSGAMATIKDTALIALSKGLEPLFNRLRDGAVELAHNSDAWVAWGNTIKDVAEGAGRGLDHIGTRVNYIHGLLQGLHAQAIGIQQQLIDQARGMVFPVGAGASPLTGFLRKGEQGPMPANQIVPIGEIFGPKLSEVIQSPAGLPALLPGDKEKEKKVKEQLEEIALTWDEIVRGGLEFDEALKQVHADLVDIIKNEGMEAAIQHMIRLGKTGEDALDLIRDANREVQRDIADAAKAAADAAEFEQRDWERAVEANRRLQEESKAIALKSIEDILRERERMAEEWQSKVDAVNQSRLSAEEWFQGQLKSLEQIRLTQQLEDYKAHNRDILAASDSLLREQEAQRDYFDRKHKAELEDAAQEQKRIGQLALAGRVLGVSGGTSAQLEFAITQALSTANDTQLQMLDVLQAIRDGAVTISDIGRRIGAVQQRRGRIIAAFGGGAME